MSLTLRRLVLAVGFLASLTSVAVAQEDEGPVTEAERVILLPIAELREKADKELQEKKFDAAIAMYKDASERLEKAKVREFLRKEVGQVIHYNWACGLSLTGKKDEAVKELALSVDEGYWIWKDIEKDPDLDAIRKEPGYKKAIDDGKAAEKTWVAAEEKKLPERVKKAIAGKPLFAMDVDAETIDGKPISEDELHGKAVIVHYFKVGEDESSPEIALLLKLYDAYKAKGLEIVGVGDGEKDALTDFVKAKGIKWPVTRMGGANDPLRLVASRHALQLAFLDRGGKVRGKANPFHAYEPLEEAVKLLLDTKTPPAEEKKDE